MILTLLGKCVLPYVLNCDSIISSQSQATARPFHYDAVPPGYHVQYKNPNLLNFN